METSPKQPSSPLLNVWALATNLGFIIAVPLVVLVMIGIKVDARLGTTPLFIISGMLVAMVISIISITRKVRRLSK